MKHQNLARTAVLPPEVDWEDVLTLPVVATRTIDPCPPVATDPPAADSAVAVVAAVARACMAGTRAVEDDIDCV